MISDVPGRKRRQFSIARVMIAIAGLAVVLAMPRLATSPADLLARCLMALLVGFFLLHFLTGEFVGYPCPVCSRWALRRLARHRRYYRCSACGARLKRYWLGPWLDATGHQDAAKYRKPTDAGTWKGYEPPGRLDDSTSGHLLENKRSRGGTGEGIWHAASSTSSRRVEDAGRKVRAVLGRLREIRE
jgi:hypothetical protein